MKSLEQVLYKHTTTQFTVHLDEESPIFGESSITVKLDDEAGGAFLVLEDTLGGKISVDYEQWKILNKAVDVLFSQSFEGV